MTSLKVADFDTSKDANLLNKQKKQSKTAKKIIFKLFILQNKHSCLKFLLQKTWKMTNLKVADFVSTKTVLIKGLIQF